MKLISIQTIIRNLKKKKMEMTNFLGYPEIILAFLCFLIVRRLSNKSLPTNWPLLGILPSVIVNINRFHDFLTEILSKNGCTFMFKGPWFTNMANIVMTSDPDNIRYIFNTNFSNYPKGPELKEILDFLGDGIFTADFESWRMLRKSSHQLLSGEKFQRWVKKTVFNKVEKVLLPVLEHVLEHDLVVDLQDMFQRFTFDTMSTIFSGTDPGCLSIEFKEVPYVKAFKDANEALFYRQVMSQSCWKFLRFLQIGSEKKMTRAVEIIDKFIADCISKKREQLSKESGTGKEEEEGLDLLALYLEDEDHNSDKFLRDTMINFMEGGKDGVAACLTWFIWLVSINPSVETKILEELKAKAILLSDKECKKWKVFDMSELKELVYLHATLCETLRLYAPLPFELKQPLKPDILPSGHKVDPNMKIIPILYSVGRMETVWGKDCLEFKPERWISEEGGIKHVPSHKFVSFLSGPRTCLGKEVAFIQMKLAAAAFVFSYRVEVVDPKSVSLQNSIKLSMKKGLKAKVKRRFA